MRFSKLLLSFLVMVHSSLSSAFIMPKSISLKSISKVSHLTIIRNFNNNNQNNNQNKSKIFKINFNNNDELYNFDDNLIKLSIIICIYLYVNIWLIYIFFDVIKLIYI